MFGWFKKKKKDKDPLAGLGDGSFDDSGDLMDLPPFPGSNKPLPKLPPISGFPDLPQPKMPMEIMPPPPPPVKKPDILPKMSIFGKKIEEKIYDSDKPKLRQRVVMQADEPLFVSSEHYRFMLGDLLQLKSIFRDSTDFAVRLEELEKGREKQLDELRKSIEGIQRKLIVMDKILFK